MSSPDDQIRLAAWEHVQGLKALYGTIPSRELRKGFPFNGETVHLVGSTGIFRPRQMTSLLSLLTTNKSDYRDDWIDDLTLAYDYHEGSKPYTNDWMRQAVAAQHPVIYFEQLPDATYDADLVFIVQDLPAERRVLLRAGLELASTAEEAPPYRESRPASYAEGMTKRRRHQAWFSSAVMKAYAYSCAVCQLQRRPLLDAAHILPDAQTPEVSARMGIAMCKIHHAAFDIHILGVEPGSHRVHLKEDVLQEVDGPMLKHGLQEMHGRTLTLPRAVQQRPDSAALEQRWEKFIAS